MSLKVFHIVFVAFSILLSLGFAGWEISGYVDDGSRVRLLWAAVALLICLALVAYGIRFIKKMKEMRVP